MIVFSLSSRHIHSIAKNKGIAWCVPYKSLIIYRSKTHGCAVLESVSLIPEKNPTSYNANVNVKLGATPILSVNPLQSLSFPSCLCRFMEQIHEAKSFSNWATLCQLRCL